MPVRLPDQELSACQGKRSPHRGTVPGAILSAGNSVSVRPSRKRGLMTSDDLSLPGNRPETAQAGPFVPGSNRAPGNDKRTSRAPPKRAEAVPAVAEEIDVRAPEQAKRIIAERSLRKGLAKYGRI